MAEKNNNRRTIALTKVELVLIKEGLTKVLRESNERGDEFKAVVTESTLGHIQTVLTKMNAPTQGAIQ
jgi:hypothetical protein